MIVFRFLKVFSFLIIFLFSFPLVFANFEVCEVQFNEPWFEVKQSSGIDVLIIDKDGNMYAKGEDHSLNNKNSYESFVVGDVIHFNHLTSRYSNLFPEVSSISNNGLIIRNIGNQNVARLDNSGIIYLRGQAAVQGEKANCGYRDGRYCNTDGFTREIRDYFCEITGDKSGFCDYIVTYSLDCRTKPSVMGTRNHFLRDTVTYYTGDCLAGNCSNQYFTDTCIDTSNLREYWTTSGSTDYYSEVKNCNDYNYNQCSGLIYQLVTHNCANGRCVENLPTNIQTCNSGPTTFSSTYCIGNQVWRDVTTRPPICSASTGCAITISTSQQLVQTCSDKCEGGSCVAFSNCNLGGVTVNHGDSRNFYSSSSVPYGYNCNDIRLSRSCNDGTLSGSSSYSFASCSVQSASGCTLPWGGSINHGQTITAFQSSSVPSGSTCNSQTRSCNDGVLSGTYGHQSCFVETIPTCPSGYTYIEAGINPRVPPGCYGPFLPRMTSTQIINECAKVGGANVFYGSGWHPRDVGEILNDVGYVENHLTPLLHWGGFNTGDPTANPTTYEGICYDYKEAVYLGAFRRTQYPLTITHCAIYEIFDGTHHSRCYVNPNIHCSPGEYDTKTNRLHEEINCVNPASISQVVPH